jgi:predicted PurR-regulated permease PerM
MENNHNDKLVRLETLLEIMNQKIDELTINYKDLPNRLTKLEVENSQQQKEIDELKQNAKDTKKWIWGIISTIIGGVLLATIKFFIGI